MVSDRFFPLPFLIIISLWQGRESEAGLEVSQQVGVGPGVCQMLRVAEVTTLWSLAYRRVTEC